MLCDYDVCMYLICHLMICNLLCSLVLLTSYCIPHSLAPRSSGLVRFISLRYYYYPIRLPVSASNLSSLPVRSISPICYISTRHLELCGPHPIPVSILSRWSAPKGLGSVLFPIRLQLSGISCLALSDTHPLCPHSNTPSKLICFPNNR